MGAWVLVHNAVFFLKLMLYLPKAKHSSFPVIIFTNLVAVKLNNCEHKLLPFFILNFVAGQVT